MKKPVMYLFLNRGLGMSTGKSAAQVAHAACEAMSLSDPKAVDAWRLGGHYTKLVMLAEDETQMLTIQHYLEDRGFRVAPIIDEGRTEIKPFSRTALGVEIVDKADDHVAATFGEFKTYKDEGYVVRATTDIDEADALMRVPYEYLNREGKKAFMKLF